MLEIEKRACGRDTVERKKGEKRDEVFKSPFQGMLMVFLMHLRGSGSFSVYITVCVIDFFICYWYTQCYILHMKE